MPATKWKQGEHVIVIGDTGTGKTYLESKILPIRQHVILLRTKPDDIIFDGFRKIKTAASTGVRAVAASLCSAGTGVPPGRADGAGYAGRIAGLAALRRELDAGTTDSAGYGEGAGAGFGHGDAAVGRRRVAYAHEIGRA